MNPLSTQHLGKRTEMMDEDRYWLIVKHSLQASHNQRTQEEYLINRLVHMSLEDMIGFRLRTDKLLYDSYRAELLCPAIIMNGGCSDDCFEYFRLWLISRGKETFYATLKDPDILVKEVIPDAPYYEFELFWYVALEAFKFRTGKDLYDFIDYDKFRTREGYYPSLDRHLDLGDPKNLQALCPNLFARLWR